MSIQGMDGLTSDQLTCELQNGGRFVLYTYTISILILTFRQSSDICFVRAGESRVLKGLPYTITTVLLGWWGIPWGPIYSIGSLITNLGGGRDVTETVVATISKA